MEYSKKRIIKKAIPGKNPNGAVDTISFQRDLTIKAVSLSVNVKHSNASAVSINLTGPNGKTVKVLGSGKAQGQNIKQTFKGDVMNDLLGGKSKGNWVIKIADNSSQDGGSLADWELHWTLANSKRSEVFIEDKEDLASVQYCHQFGAIESISADVKVEHGHVGDLIMILTSPSGKAVTLHDRVGGAGKEIKKTYSAADLSAMNGEKAKGKWTMKISDTMPRDSGRLVSWKLNIKTGERHAMVVAPPSLKDDLKKIEGIGPKIEGLLNGGGIKTWRELAKADVVAIKKILEAAGPRYQMHDPGSWPRQSQLAANGDWATLEKLQDELQGGK